MICNLSLEQWRTIVTIVASALTIVTTIIALLCRCYRRIKFKVDATIILEGGDYYLKLENNGENTIRNIKIKFEESYLRKLRCIADDFIDNNYTTELFENIKTIQNKKYALATGKIVKLDLTPFVNIYECRGLIGEPESTLFCKYQENIELYLSTSEVKKSNLPFSKTIIIKSAK